MQVPLQITFHQLPHLDALASQIRKKAARLEKFYPRITSIRIFISPSTRRHHQGNLYNVRIDLTLPGHEIIVNRDPSEHHAHEDPYVAVRDAFRAMRRQLEDHVRMHFRTKKRHHEEPAHGRVLRLFLLDDCGFLKAQDGREIYFHRHSVLDPGFNKLAVGDEVRFVEAPGEKGPQASTVQHIGTTGSHLMGTTKADQKPVK